MRVIVTRPQGEAERWVLALARLGIGAWALPLIEIRPLSDTRAMASAWQASGQYEAIMFVSTPAVEHFFALRPDGIDTVSPARAPRFWAPGPGTVAALVRQGVAATRIDAPAPDAVQFDSEALWQQVAGQVGPGWRVLVVRGAEHAVGSMAADSGADAGSSDGAAGQGREWLADRLRQAGARVFFVAAYWRAAPTTQTLLQALRDESRGEDDLWLFTSAQAIRHLCARLPKQDWSGARAMVTHRRIARAARAAGFGVVHESRPALGDIAASIKSLQ